MRIVVAYAEPGAEALVDLTVAPGTTVADAVAASGLIDRFELKPSMLAYAIFGQRVGAETPVAEGDRVELLRPLVADPKETRRRRARARS
jgi:uncharacterized protein